ncbi:hypothetical protein [Thermococcus sp.]|nr:hypothetical protein [Thermococcus sp.]
MVEMNVGNPALSNYESGLNLGKNLKTLLKPFSGKDFYPLIENLLR